MAIAIPFSLIPEKYSKKIQIAVAFANSGVQICRTRLINMAEIPTTTEIRELLDSFKREILATIQELLADKARDEWLKGSEIKKLLKISESKLQTLRIKKEIIFKKLGGTYYYKA